MIKPLEKLIERSTKYYGDDAFIRVCSYCHSLIDAETDYPIKLSMAQYYILNRDYGEHLSHGIDLDCLAIELDKLRGEYE